MGRILLPSYSSLLHHSTVRFCLPKPVAPINSNSWLAGHKVLRACNQWWIEWIYDFFLTYIHIYIQCTYTVYMHMLVVCRIALLGDGPSVMEKLDWWWVSGFRGLVLCLLLPYWVHIARILCRWGCMADLVSWWWESACWLCIYVHHLLPLVIIGCCYVTQENIWHCHGLHINKQMDCSHSTVAVLSAIDHALWHGVVLSDRACWSIAV